MYRLHPGALSTDDSCLPLECRTYMLALTRHWQPRAIRCREEPGRHSERIRRRRRVEPQAHEAVQNVGRVADPTALKLRKRNESLNVSIYRAGKSNFLHSLSRLSRLLGFRSLAEFLESGNSSRHKALGLAVTLPVGHHGERIRPWRSVTKPARPVMRNLTIWKNRPIIGASCSRPRQKSFS